MRKAARNPYFWLGLGFSALFLYLAVKDVQWPRVARALVDTDLRFLLLGVVLLVACYLTFAVRWKVMLVSAARVPVDRLFSYIMIGYLANTVLPLRLGDMVRATLFGRRTGIRISLTLGTVFLERVLDVLTLLLFSLVLASAVEIPVLVRTSLSTLAVAALAALGMLLIAAFNERRLDRLRRLMPSFVPPAVQTRIVDLVSRFSQGVHALKRPMVLAPVLLLSILSWGLAGLATMSWVRAFHLSVPWYAGFFVLVVVNLGAAIPSSPGFIGVYHYLAVLALSIWIPDKSVTLGYALVTHALSLLSYVLLGAACLMREGTSLRAGIAFGSEQSDAP